jgi:DNA-directed DNA polymerase III PolC
MDRFVHLRVQSCHSHGRGGSTPGALLSRAVSLGYRRLALTDRNGLYGAVDFYRAAREKGIVPILGAEVDDPTDPSRAVTVLAADRGGFTSLCRMVTRRHLEEGFDLVAEAGRLGPGCRLLASREELLAELSATPARPVTYASIGPRELSGDGRPARLLAARARVLGVPVVAAGDVLFAAPGDLPVQRLVRAIGLVTTLERVPPEEAALPSQHLAPADEMAGRFLPFPGALEAAARLADECAVELDVGVWKYPGAAVPPGETPFSLLWQKAARGLGRRYRPVTPEAVRRLARELSVIQANGFAPYFLLVDEILAEARRRGMRHVGRGSAANSLVSYLLGFTAVDPLAHDLLFERFMNPARSSPPDIDLDFSWRERDGLLRWVFERYGADRVAMIGTHVTFGPRAALRETARAMGLPPAEIGPVTRRVPHWGVDSLAALPATVPECRDLPFDREPWAGIVALAQAIVGFPRHLSVHPGGIIVAPEPLERWVPLQRAAGGHVVTQYEMHAVEAIGLIKIDLLSQRSLGVLEDCLRGLAADAASPGGVASDGDRAARAQRSEHGGEVAGDRTPPGVAPFPRQTARGCSLSTLEDLAAVGADPAVRAMLREGRTMGIFYVESPAMRSLLRKLGTETFGELTAASSVIRPGVAESGMMDAYISRHRDPGKVTFLHPTLEEVLGETHGVMIYQEDVIRVAHRVAGVSLAEADLLRRAMSGKERSRDGMASLRTRFIAGARRNGVPGPVAAELWRQVESFAGYAFCKAHSASYAVLSMQLAWLKVHHPARFMAAVLANGGGFYTPDVYLQECRRMGLRVLPPDVNRSADTYTADGADGVRLGLSCVKGLTRKGIDALLASREADGRFRSPADLRARARLNRAELDALVRCGACDSLGGNRPSLLLRMMEAEAGGGALLCEPLAERRPEVRDYTLAERCRAEAELLGFPLSAHPLELCRGAIPRGTVSAADLPRLAGRRVRMAGRPISAKRVVTRGGEAMKFLSLEDLTGTFEAVIFPDVHRRTAAITLDGAPLLLDGLVEESFGVASLTVSGVRRLAPG